MVDRISEEARSWNMSRIKSKNTKPEIRVRSALHRMGFRFTVNGPSNTRLPGRPDIVLPKHSTVIFVHGCFWHRHENCRETTTPKTRTEWWLAKFDANVRRDRANVKALEKLGWRPVVIWECQTKCPEKLMAKIRRQLGSD